MDDVLAQGATFAGKPLPPPPKQTPPPTAPKKLETVDDAVAAGATFASKEPARPEIRGYGNSLPGQVGAPPVPGDSPSPSTSAKRPAPTMEEFEDLRRLVNELRDGQWHPRALQSPFVVKVTGFDGAGRPAWQEQCFVGGSWQAFAGGRNSASGAYNLGQNVAGVSGAIQQLGTGAVYIGQILVVWEILDPATNAYVYQCVGMPTSVLVSGLVAWIPNELGTSASYGLYLGGAFTFGGVSVNTGTASNVFSPPIGSAAIAGNGALVFNGLEGPSGTPTDPKNAHMLGGLGLGVGSIVHQLFLGMVVGIVDAADPEFAGYWVVIISSFPPPAFPVWLIQDGGSDGTNTAPATYTYTATNANGETIGTAMTPLRPRPVGKLLPAAAAAPPEDSANGLAVIIQAGETWNYYLWDAGEVSNFSAVTVVTGVDFTTPQYFSTTILSPT